MLDALIDLIPILRNSLFSDREKRFIAAAVLLSLPLTIFFISFIVIYKYDVIEDKNENKSVEVEGDDMPQRFILYDNIEKEALYTLLANTFRKNNLEYAETVVEKITSSDPNDNFAKYFSAKIKIENKKYAEAYTILQELKVKKYMPDSIETQLISVVSFDELEDMIKDTNSLSALQLAKVGERFVLDDKDSIAHIFFKKALQSDSSSPEALYQAARWDMNKNNYKTAEILLKKLLLIDSISPRTQGRYAMLLHETGRPRQALAYYKRAIALNEYDYNLAYNLGELYLTPLNDNENAEKYFLKSIEIKPNLWQSYFKLALISLENNLNDAAINYLIKADGYSPQNPRILNLLAAAYEKKKDYGNALKIYDKLLEINPLDDMALYKRSLLGAK